VAQGLAEKVLVALWFAVLRLAADLPKSTGCAVSRGAHGLAEKVLVAGFGAVLGVAVHFKKYWLPGEG